MGQIKMFGQIANDRAESNPNLLDNWDFRNPINQRGQTEYASKVLTNTVDRWGIVPLASNTDEAKITIGGGGITLSNVNDYSFLVQRLEDALFQSLRGKEVTLSVIADDVLQTASAVVPVSAATSEKVIINKAIPNGALQLSEKYTASGTYLRVQLRADPGKSVKFAAAKLELGDKQTLARQNAEGNWLLIDPPPDPTLELLKCQRYFYRLRTQNSNNYGVLAFGFVNSSSQARFVVALPAAMRINPTVTSSGKLQYAFGSTASAVKSVATQSWNGSSIVLIANTDSTNISSVGTAVVFGNNNDENAYVDFSAEL